MLLTFGFFGSCSGREKGAIFLGLPGFHNFSTDFSSIVSRFLFETSRSDQLIFVKIVNDNVSESNWAAPTHVNQTKLNTESVGSGGGGVDAALNDRKFHKSSGKIEFERDCRDQNDIATILKTFSHHQRLLLNVESIVNTPSVQYDNTSAETSAIGGSVIATISPIHRPKYNRLLLNLRH